MAQGSKALTTLNQVLELDVPDDSGGVVGIQYGAFGADGTTAATGTVVVEGSINGVEWYAGSIVPQAGGAGVASLTAPGLGSVKLGGAARARARMSVVGGAQGVKVGLNTAAT